MYYSHYAAPASVEEAWALNQKRSNHILAGGLWLRFMKQPFDTAIDLKNLGLDRIDIFSDSIRIGSSVTLHQLETDATLNTMTGNAFRTSLQNIVGVQFRNAATVGGTIFSRFGFSDLIPLLLVLDASVTFYGGDHRTVPLREFLDFPFSRDLIISVEVPNQNRKVVCRSQRLSSTGFPVLVCDTAIVDGRVITAIGARPARARLMEQQLEETPSHFIARVQSDVRYESNLMGSDAYRRYLSGIFLKRNISELNEGGMIL